MGITNILQLWAIAEFLHPGNKAIIKSTKRAICKEILASFESYKRENPSCPALISLTVKAQLKSLSGKWWKGQNWLHSGQWLIWNSNNSSQPAPLRGWETRGVSFIWLNVLEVNLSADIKQQQPRNRHHSKDCDGVSCCICLSKSNMFMLMLCGWVQPRMQVTFFCDSTRAHAGAVQSHQPVAQTRINTEIWNDSFGLN